MNLKKFRLPFCCVLLLLAASAATAQHPVWSNTKAAEWYRDKGWLRGCDFIPSTAINQLEMWQKESFDSATIDRELGYAQGIGLNCMRVFLHHLAWQTDSASFKKNISCYLGIADRHGIKTIFVFFDDCWNETYAAGKQPVPRIGVHNSGWLRDPGKLLYDQPTLTTVLEMYVKDILTRFGQDPRVLLWDLYNEPGGSGYKNQSLPLLKLVFSWARQVNPTQPLSVGLWSSELPELNRFQLAASDVITYHDYQPAEKHQATVDSLKKYLRPLICTEYMARTRNSLFRTVMPMLKKENVGAINWGLVTGKTNTMYAWDTPMPDGKEPAVWFHDIFRPDGSPFDPQEIAVIKKLTETSNR